MIAKYRHAWTPNEDSHLRALWGVHTIEQIAEAMGRPRIGVHARARRLGLSFGTPSGTETLSRASKRTGFSHQLLSKILRANNVPSYRAMSTPANPAAPKRACYDPAQVDAAVIAWEASESVRHAAISRGIPDTMLRAWLRRAGLRAPSKGRTWRVPSQTIDAVVAARRAA